MDSGDKVAIKLESFKAMPPSLRHESIVYQIMSGGPGIATYYEYGMAGKYNFVAMELLGPSLKNVFLSRAKMFSPNTVSTVAEQMITCLQYVHSKGLVHRDVKPSNICIGAGPNASQTYLVDFGSVGVCAQGIEIEDGFCGTATWASIGAHGFEKQSQRDDLESLGYTLAYLTLGSLPWEGKRAESDDDHNELVDAKHNFIFKNHDLPDNLVTYLKRAHRRRQTDYDHLRSLFPTSGQSVDWLIGTPPGTGPDELNHQLETNFDESESVSIPQMCMSDRPWPHTSSQVARGFNSAPPPGSPCAFVQGFEDVMEFKDECEDFIRRLDMPKVSQIMKALDAKRLISVHVEGV
jgi:serine/threonine protein kinase